MKLSIISNSKDGNIEGNIENVTYKLSDNATFWIIYRKLNNINSLPNWDCVANFLRDNDI